MNYRFRPILLLAAGLCCSPLGSQAAEKGWFGFALAIDADGIFSPTLRSIKIDKVFADSPAAKAGLEAGDMIVAVEGIAVAGAKPDALKAAMHKSAGETLRLKIQRSTDAAHDISLVAAAKPDS